MTTFEDAEIDPFTEAETAIMVDDVVTPRMVAMSKGAPVHPFVTAAYERQFRLEYLCSSCSKRHRIDTDGWNMGLLTGYLVGAGAREIRVKVRAEN